VDNVAEPSEGKQNEGFQFIEPHFDVESGTGQ
jgi:hypothetical protein